MVGYCCKDSGRSHYKTFRKNVTKSEDNVALAEYRKKERLNVKDNRVELGKKNIWPVLQRFKQVLSPYIQSLSQMLAHVHIRSFYTAHIFPFYD